MSTPANSTRLTPPEREVRIRHWLEYAGLRLALAIVRMVPLEFAARILGAGCRVCFSRNRRHRRALANIALAMPEKTEAEREAIILAMWENVGRIMAEGAHIDVFLAEPHRIDAIDMRSLDDYAESKGVCVIVGMHSGNWEIGLLPSHRYGYHPIAFYRTISNPLVDRYIKTSREKIYDGGMFAMRGEVPGGGGSESRSRQLASCLRDGVPIGILMDQFDHKGVVVPFFGHGIKISRGPATLALHFRAKVYAARSVRKGSQCRFVGEVVDIEIPDTGDRQADIQATTAAIMSRFEDWIREFPEQWLWSQAPFIASDGTYLGVAAPNETEVTLGTDGIACRSD